MSSLTLNTKRKPFYPGGNPNYRENSVKYYANRKQIRYEKQYSSQFTFKTYEDIDEIKIVKFKTPKHEWEEEWYQSDIEFMSSPQAWTRYIKLRDLQLFYENIKNDKHHYQKWNDIQYLIEEHPFIFKDNNYGHEFGELVYNNDCSDSDDQNQYQSNDHESNDHENIEDGDDYDSDYY
tara:strand:- start:809 stop:1342 length:534 start_codon:yes stop_codon:yes gene_type:complete